MRYIEKNGMKLSRIGLGTGRMGTLLDEGLSFDMLDLFAQSGGTVVDTARNYYEWVEHGRGVSEKTIGRWMGSRKNRDDVVISTKGGVRNEGRVFAANLSRANLTAELEESMQALDTDRLDIYLLHRDEPERPVEEIVETLQELKLRGRARMIGVCNWKPARVKAANEYAAAHSLFPLDVVQTYWSIAAYTEAMWNDPTTTGMDREMYDYLLANDMTAMAFTSQAKGFFQKACREGLDRISPKLKERLLCAENEARLARIQRYCDTENVSPTAVVNAYITQNPLPGVALVSCSDLRQLRDILDNCDVEISNDFLAQFSL